MLRLISLPEQEAGWRQDYLAMQEEMFSAPPPTFDVVLRAVAELECVRNTRNAFRALGAFATRLPASTRLANATGGAPIMPESPVCCGATASRYSLLYHFRCITM